MTLRDRGEVVATVELGASDDGRVEVTVPKLRRGLHLFTAQFTGADPWQDSRSRLPVAVYAY